MRFPFALPTIVAFTLVFFFPILALTVAEEPKSQPFPQPQGKKALQVQMVDDAINRGIRPSWDSPETKASPARLAIWDCLKPKMSQIHRNKRPANDGCRSFIFDSPASTPSQRQENMTRRIENRRSTLPEDMVGGRIWC